MIIAIDAASTDLSVALAGPDGAAIDELAWTSSRRQSAELLPRLLELLERNSRSIADAAAIAVGTGPGSFTGLRVAMAVAKGLAVALAKPIVGVPSLEAWLDAEADATAAVARAGAQEAYVLARGADGPAIVDREGLAERMAQAPVLASAEVAEAFGLGNARPPRGAAAVAARAARHLAHTPEGDDLRRLEPIYLRPPRGVPSESEGLVRWL